MIRPDRKPRVLLIVAPTAQECFWTAEAFGLDRMKLGEARCITKPPLLRGWSRGTPFIARDKDRWSTETGAQLARVLDAMMFDGRLRIANPKDLAEFQEEGTA